MTGGSRMLGERKYATIQEWADDRYSVAERTTVFRSRGAYGENAFMWHVVLKGTTYCDQCYTSFDEAIEAATSGEC